MIYKTVFIFKGYLINKFMLKRVYKINFMRTTTTYLKYILVHFELRSSDPELIFFSQLSWIRGKIFRSYPWGVIGKYAGLYTLCLFVTLEVLFHDRMYSFFLLKTPIYSLGFRKVHLDFDFCLTYASNSVDLKFNKKTLCIHRFFNSVILDWCDDEKHWEK